MNEPGKSKDPFFLETGTVTKEKFEYYIKADVCSLILLAGKRLSQKQIDELFLRKKWGILHHGKHLLSQEQINQGIKAEPHLALMNMAHDMTEAQFKYCSWKSPWTALKEAPGRMTQECVIDLCNKNEEKVSNILVNFEKPELIKVLFKIEKKISPKLKKTLIRIASKKV